MDNFDQFAATLRGALDQADAEGALFSKIEARRHEDARSLVARRLGSPGPTA